MGSARYYQHPGRVKPQDKPFRARGKGQPGLTPDPVRAPLKDRLIDISLTYRDVSPIEQEDDMGGWPTGPGDFRDIPDMLREIGAEGCLWNKLLWTPPGRKS